LDDELCSEADASLSAVGEALRMGIGSRLPSVVDSRCALVERELPDRGTDIDWGGP
jgi:hypothetical protein